MFAEWIRISWQPCSHASASRRRTTALSTLQGFRVLHFEVCAFGDDKVVTLCRKRAAA